MDDEWVKESPGVDKDVMRAIMKRLPALDGWAEANAKSKRMRRSTSTLDMSSPEKVPKGSEIVNLPELQNEKTQSEMTIDLMKMKERIERLESENFILKKAQIEEKKKISEVIANLSHGKLEETMKIVNECLPRTAQKQSYMELRGMLQYPMIHEIARRIHVIWVSYDYKMCSDWVSRQLADLRSSLNNRLRTCHLSNEQMKDCWHIVHREAWTRLLLEYHSEKTFTNYERRISYLVYWSHVIDLVSANHG